MTVCLRCALREVSLRATILGLALARGDDLVARLVIVDLQRRLDRLGEFEAAS
jgi:hypothetical protein